MHSDTVRHQSHTTVKWKVALEENVQLFITPHQFNIGEEENENAILGPFHRQPDQTPETQFTIRI